jgi:hypothetical protein
LPPNSRYIDESTAARAANSIARLGRRQKKNTAALNQSQSDKDIIEAEAKPWFMAVGFLRPHLPFVCPGRFWDAAGDNPSGDYPRAKSPSKAYSFSSSSSSISFTASGQSSASVIDHESFIFR